MSTHSQCFKAKIRKNVYPGKPQFYYIKVGFKGDFVTRTYFHGIVQACPLISRDCTMAKLIE